MTKRIRRTTPPSRWIHWVEPMIVIMVVCVLALIIMIGSTGIQKEVELRIWFFDIGQGDSTLLLLPTGEKILIDAGRDNRVLAKIGSVLPPWDRSIDILLITHPDADHITGFVDILARYDVGEIFMTGASAYTPVMQALEAQIDREQTPVRYVSQGDRFLFGEVILDILWPEAPLIGMYPKDRNDSSVVTRLVYKDTSILFTGDAGHGAEQNFGMLVGDIDVLTAGHHGSSSSTSIDFLQDTRPEIVTISVGAENHYGHPHPVILYRIKELGAHVLRTDLDGDLLLISEGGEPNLTSHPLLF
jgi:competence protein ComEC